MPDNKYPEVLHNLKKKLTVTMPNLFNGLSIFAKQLTILYCVKMCIEWLDKSADHDKTITSDAASRLDNRRMNTATFSILSYWAFLRDSLFLSILGVSEGARGDCVLWTLLLPCWSILEQKLDSNCIILYEFIRSFEQFKSGMHYNSDLFPIDNSGIKNIFLPANP
jgi:hypothetical protein